MDPGCGIFDTIFELRRLVGDDATTTLVLRGCGRVGFMIETGLEFSEGFTGTTEEGEVEFVHGECFIVIQNSHFECVAKSQEMHFFYFQHIGDGNGNLQSIR